MFSPPRRQSRGRKKNRRRGKTRGLELEQIDGERIIRKSIKMPVPYSTTCIERESHYVEKKLTFVSIKPCNFFQT